MTIAENFKTYAKVNGLKEVTNDFGETRNTMVEPDYIRIIYSNGYCASIAVHENDFSVAVVDYNGYFCWAKNGKDYPIICHDENSLMRECEIIRNFC